MNTHARPSALLPAADAPDGPARRRWTLAELEHMVAAGVIAEDERIELIDGEVVAMSPKGRWHEIVRNALALHWSRKSSTDIGIATETPLQLAPKTSPESDIIIYPASLVAPDVRGDTVLLVVEIADSSISYDLKIKAPIYAAFGVREYWVIDARSLLTTVHRDPRDGNYSSIIEVAGTEIATPVAVPTLSIRLANFVSDHA